MKKFIIKTNNIKAGCIDFVSRLPIEPFYEVIIQEHKTKRSLDQNRKMWAVLRDIANQVEWYGNKLTKEDWKCIFTSALKQTKVVPNLDSTGFVSIGLYTSKMSVKGMNDLITLIEAFGAEKGVKWTANDDGTYLAIGRGDSYRGDQCHEHPQERDSGLSMDGDINR
jgi:hypothetical protein